jgi:hypothetical protein
LAARTVTVTAWAVVTAASEGRWQPAAPKTTARPTPAV